MPALLVLGAATVPPQPPPAIFSEFRYEGHQSANAKSDPPPGQYRNPIIQGSYSDPTVLRDGRDYYLSTSSFTLWPGLPIFHSRDLVHWKQIGSALDRPAQLAIRGVDTWQGIYAPALASHAGTFYLITTCAGCGGSFILTAKRPEGPWSDPHPLPFEGIDPSLFFDVDGRAYVVNNGPPEGPPRYDGHRAIWLQEIDVATFRMTGPRRVIVDGGAHPADKPFWIEGPHLFRKDGLYYLICAEGGTKEAHHEVVFRARDLSGPWQAADQPILTQLGLDPLRPDPVVQAGHADFVETPAGEWWAVFLASRPWGPHELDYNTGRETFLLPVAWRDGWPSVLPPGKPVPLVARSPRLPPAPTGEPHGGDYAIVDDFRTASLSSGWAMLGTPDGSWWKAGGGTLRITPRPAPLGGTAQPALLAIRQQHANATASVRVDFAATPGARAGLTAYQGVRRFLALSVTGRPEGGREVRLERMAGDSDPLTGALIARVPLPDASPVHLRIVAAGARYSFAYALDGRHWRAVGGVQDGSILSPASSGGFTGTLFGLFADGSGAAN